MAAVKQLMLRRADARQILDSLAEDDNREQRYAVAAALLDIAAVSATAVPPDLVHRLTGDPDAAVAAKTAEVGRVIAGVTDDERRRQFGPFGL
jgi:thioredoxin-like negative regulator of GroEL